MSTWLRTTLPLLAALALAAPAAAQSAAAPTTVADRFALSAVVGPSFANTGTTFAASAGLNFTLNDWTSLVGEVGTMQRAPFRDATEIAPPAPATGTARVNAYHWNANLKVKPFEFGRFEPYVTGGLGWFSADTIVNDQVIGTTHFEDRRRATDFATNVGAGVNYHLTDWLGVGADYRSFFVYRDNSTPHVDRFTAGLTLSLK